MTGTEAPSLLEQRYRRWLRLLPRPYRVLREQEMVEVFLDCKLAVDPDNADITQVYGRPGAGEVASVIALAIRLRRGGDDAPARYRARTLAIQWFALAGLLVNAVLAVNILVWQLVSAPEPWIQQFNSGSVELVLATVGTVLWVPAFLFSICNRPRIARLLAVGAVIPLVVQLAVQWGRFPTSATGWALPVVNGALILALGAFRRDTLRVAARPWLVAALVGIAAMQLVWGIPARALWWLVFDTPAWWFFALVAGTVVVAVLGRRAEPQRRAAMFGFLACGAAAVTLLRIASTVDQSRWLAPATADAALLLHGSVTQLVVASMICVGAAVAAVVATGRLPAIEYGVIEAR